MTEESHKAWAVCIIFVAMAGMIGWCVASIANAPESACHCKAEKGAK